MDSKEFVKQLKSIAPNEQTLYEEGLSKEEVNNLLSSYNLKIIDDNQVVNDPLLDLIYRFNVSNFDIGMVHLKNREEVIETDNFIVFGNFDRDEMAIDKINDEVVVIDYESLSEKLWYCSKNTNSFMEAILLAGKLNNEKCFNDEIYNNKELISIKAQEIANVAGGAKYLPFYQMILGIED